MSKITDSARGQECQIRYPGYCNRDPATTVYCHLNMIGYKKNDLFGAYGCSGCHDVYDRRRGTEIYADVIRLYFLEGMVRTQDLLQQQKLIFIAVEWLEIPRYLRRGDD